MDNFAEQSRQLYNTEEFNDTSQTAHLRSRKTKKTRTLPLERKKIIKTKFDDIKKPEESSFAYLKKTATKGFNSIVNSSGDEKHED
jgi:hypothetical protein